MPAEARPRPDIFAKDNLVAWCIVPFDARKRGPEERARMLQNLGIRKFAYDWRDKDIPTFDAEIDALAHYGIKLQAFWLTSGANAADDKHVSVVLDLLRRRRIRTELWYLFVPPRDFVGLSQEQKIAMASQPVRYLAEQAGRIGCTVGLYNHGGWFGEPENQIAILDRVKMKNVGMVYNFHHGREQMDRFAELFPKMLPHLLAINLNGMKKDGPMIIPLGDGDRELEMLRLIRQSRYRGPIGILGHRPEQDAEVSLRQNLAGLQRLLKAMGDEAALRTY
ncbi:MAG: sugar phosphate isomerase/epimerase [Acidobacteria bacterium]|nr:sugar phosphate isomerase/epimerase [Acidobacteriota bacterium]